MSRMKAYKIYNINEIEHELEISLYAFSRTIPDRYITRFLEESSTTKDVTTLIEELTEGDYDKRKVVINDYDDLTLEVIASTDWVVKDGYDRGVYLVGVKIEFLLEDDESTRYYNHIDFYNVEVRLKS